MRYALLVLIVLVCRENATASPYKPPATPPTSPQPTNGKLPSWRATALAAAVTVQRAPGDGIVVEEVLPREEEWPPSLSADGSVAALRERDELRSGLRSADHRRGRRSQPFTPSFAGGGSRRIVFSAFGELFSLNLTKYDGFLAPLLIVERGATSQLLPIGPPSLEYTAGEEAVDEVAAKATSVHISPLPHRHRRPVAKAIRMEDIVESGASRRDKMLSLQRNCFYSGAVDGDANSLVVGNICHGLLGLFRHAGSEYRIEPNQLGGMDPTAAAATASAAGLVPHFVYKRDPPVNRTAGQQEQQRSGAADWCDSTTTRDDGAGRIEEHQAPHSKRHPHPEREGNWQLPHGKRRHRRSVSYKRNLELMVVADYLMVQRHGANLENYVMTLVAVAASIYRNNTIGSNLNIVLVKLVILENEQDGPSITSNAHDTLRSFCTWQHSKNEPDDQHPYHHDAAVLITRHDLCRAPGKCDTLGLAEIGTICRFERSCAVIEDNGLTSAFTIAHELGHLLGLTHDDDESCSKKRLGSAFIKNGPHSHNRHIMAATLDFQAAPWTWSSCSRKYLTDIFDIPLKADCLRDQPATTLPDEDALASEEMRMPGQRYTPDEQCALLFGADFKVCNYQRTCNILWCSSPNDPACRTQYTLWADGTSCGHNKWCHRGACVDRTRLPEPVDGGWSEWSAFGDCSRSCGGGVRKSERDCTRPEPSNGGSYCIGRRVRYKSCNRQACPDGAQDFRLQQCSRFDGQNFNLQSVPATVKWVPFYVDRPADKCKLYCRAESSLLANYQLADKVIDGTKCGPDTFDMCVNGACHPAGCDHELGSTRAPDLCGVCGGDNSTCAMQSYRFVGPVEKGYNNVYLLPAGAFHVEVLQTSHRDSADDDTYLALLDIRGKFLLNGDYFISRYPTDIILNNGAVVQYHGSSQRVERIAIAGRLAEPLMLVVLIAREPHPININYSFVLPLNGDVYEWQVSGSWSECSRLCQGKRKRKVTCLMRGPAAAGGQPMEVPDSKCRLLVKPSDDELEEPCNANCNLRWRAIEMGECSAHCGSGFVRIRTECVLHSFNSSVAEIVLDRHCEPSERPRDLRQCTGSCLPVAYSYSEWSECSASCGGGVQKRHYACRTLATGRDVSIAACSDQELMASRRCNLLECPPPPGWINGEWGSCSASCGRGESYRRVSCQVGNESVDESLCLRLQPRPANVKLCRLDDCPQWYAEPWQQCSATCGGRSGIQRRIVRCKLPPGGGGGGGGGLASPMDERSCSAAERPAEIRHCISVASCPTTTTDVTSTASTPSTTATTTVPSSTIRTTAVTTTRATTWTTTTRSSFVFIAAAATSRSATVIRSADVSLSTTALSIGVHSPPHRSPAQIGVVPSPAFTSFRTPVALPPLPSPSTSHPSFSADRTTGRRVIPASTAASYPPTWLPPPPPFVNMGTTGRSPVRALTPVPFHTTAVVSGDGDRVASEPARSVVTAAALRPTTEVPASTAYATRADVRAVGAPSTARSQWRYGAWTACSATCGWGVRLRYVSCRSAQGQSMNDSQCLVAAERPPSEEPCRDAYCGSWHTGRWSKCSTSCGDDATQSRYVACAIVEQGLKVVGDSECEPGKRPPSVQPCEVRLPRCGHDVTVSLSAAPPYPTSSTALTAGISSTKGSTAGAERQPLTVSTAVALVTPRAVFTSNAASGLRLVTSSGNTALTKTTATLSNRTVALTMLAEATVASTSVSSSSSPSVTYRSTASSDATTSLSAFWRVGQWSACSVSCGNGWRRRVVLCQREQTAGGASSCDAASMPTELEACSIMPCGTWQLGQWQPCPVTCGQGFRLRDVVCVQSDGTALPPAACDGQPKPAAATERCYRNPCPPLAAWSAAPWSSCSVTCGTGQRQRLVQCVDRASNSSSTAASAEVTATVLPDEYCLAMAELQQRPSAMEICSAAVDECPVWHVTDWSQCSTTCGNKGVQTRNVSCILPRYAADASKQVVRSEAVLPHQACIGTAGSITATEAAAADVPTTVRPCPQPILPCAVWHVTSWSQCSASCGTGARSRIVTCIDSDSGRPLRRTDCLTTRGSLEAPPPHEEESCVAQPCISWRPGPWSACSATCGNGSRWRMVYCADERASLVVDESRCEPATRPPASEPCRPSLDCHRWIAAAWNTCSSPCAGPGRRSRAVLCVEIATGVAVEDRMCLNAGVRPADSEHCLGLPCNSRSATHTAGPALTTASMETYEWVAQKWSACSASCGIGLKKRGVSCVHRQAGGLPAPSWRCRGLRQPKSTRECHEQTCAAAYLIEPWSACSTTCGEGRQTRRVSCKSWTPEGWPTAENSTACGVHDRPPIVRSCSMGPCYASYVWQTGPWSSKCSVPCGWGTVKRSVTCVSVHDTQQAVPRERCNSIYQPDRSSRCFAGPCYARSCSELQSLSKIAIDGDYRLLAGKTLVRIYCRGMNTKNPTEYLTLPAGSQYNYAHIYSRRLRRPADCPSLDDGYCESDLCLLSEYDRGGYTKFSRLQLNMSTLVASVDDYVFSDSKGLRKIPYGTAGDCFSMQPDCTRGQFRINLTSTDFRVARRATWYTQGNGVKARIQRLDDGQIVQGECGGFCGSCSLQPSNGLPLELAVN